MKVLYIGCYRDGTGWGYSAIDSILALDSIGIEVVPRCVQLTKNNPRLPRRLLELEQGEARGCDIVIQNILPFMMDYNGRFNRNIAYCFFETTNFRSANWAECLNQMDETWVPCEANRETCEDSFVETPIEIIPCATDITKFQKTYDPLALRDELSDSFVFYTIGEAVRRKNFAAVVKAFHLEFDPSEPVELLIKTGMRGVGPERMQERMIQDCQIIKEGLNLYNNVKYYKRELILTDHLPEEGIMRLHATGDCFVLPSYGEGWGIPIFEAMAFGKTPITTRWGGVLAYMTDETGWLIPGHREPVFGMQNVHGDLYCGWQDWYQVDITALRAAMRQAYEDHELRKKKSLAGACRAYDFSHENIGRIMKNVLSI